MKFAHILLTCLVCCFSCLVFSQERNRETIEITGSADTAITPSYYDLNITKISDNETETKWNAQNKIIKQIFSKISIDTAMVILTSVSGNSYMDNKSEHKYNVTVNLRTFDVNNISYIKALLTDNQYRVVRCVGQLSDSLVNRETIYQLLLAGAIRDGRKKVSLVARELGMTSIKFLSFKEGNFAEDKSDTRGDIISGDGSGRIKMSKHVTLVYTPAEVKK